MYSFGKELSLCVAMDARDSKSSVYGIIIGVIILFLGVLSLTMGFIPVKSPTVSDSTFLERNMV